MDTETSNVCWWKARPWFSPYLPVFSTARASLTASFTVVTRSSWGKGSHCWGEEREEEKRKEERGRKEAVDKKRKKGRKRRVVRNDKLPNPSHTHSTHKGSVDGIHKSLLRQFKK